MKTITTLALGTILTLSAGIADAAPWSKSRHSHPAPRYDDHRGHSHSHHRARHQSVETKAQLRLRTLGYYRGTIDGQFGRGSRNALIRFQRDHRLPVTARLDHRTLRALRI